MLMLIVRLDSEVPLVEQIVRGIRTSIATGAIREGDELPPVRQLANDLGINLNTVARASMVCMMSGNSVFSSPSTSSFTRSWPSSSSRASRQVRTASLAV